MEEKEGELDQEGKGLKQNQPEECGCEPLGEIKGQLDRKGHGREETFHNSQESG